MKGLVSKEKSSVLWERELERILPIKVKQTSPFPKFRKRIYLSLITIFLLTLKSSFYTAYHYLFVNSWFSHEVTAVMSEPLKKERAAMLMSQTNA